MRTASYFVLSLTFFLSGCSTSAQFAPARIDAQYASRTTPEKIEVFRSSNPTKPFEEIGAVTACCSSDVNEMIQLLRQKASESGGDGLISLDVHASGRASATVIRFR